MASTSDTGAIKPHRLTALLGERLRSRMPGYPVALAGDPAALTEDGRPTTAVVIQLGSPAVHVLCWVTPNAGPGSEWAPYTTEVRIVLRSSELDGNIADVVGGSLDVDGTEAEVDDVLELVETLLEEEVRSRYDAVDPRLAAEIHLALRTFDSDPPRR